MRSWTSTVTLTLPRLRAVHHRSRCLGRLSAFLLEDIGSAFKRDAKVCQRKLVNEVPGPLITEFILNSVREGTTPIHRVLQSGLLYRVEAVKLIRGPFPEEKPRRGDRGRGVPQHRKRRGSVRLPFIGPIAILSQANWLSVRLLTLERKKCPAGRRGNRPWSIRSATQRELFALRAVRIWNEIAACDFPVEKCGPPHLRRRRGHAALLFSSQLWQPLRAGPGRRGVTEPLGRTGRGVDGRARAGPFQDRENGASRRWAGWFLQVADVQGKFFRTPVGYPALEIVQPGFQPVRTKQSGPRRQRTPRRYRLGRSRSRGNYPNASKMLQNCLNTVGGFTKSFHPFVYLAKLSSFAPD
jgi:hypothetical protein